MQKRQIFVVDLEAVESRYTGEWKSHVPEILRQHVKGSDVIVIEGRFDIPTATTPGAFLNFGGTNVYKSDQMVKIAQMFCDGTVRAGDHFIYTDAWNPTIIQLKYMSELLGIPVKIHGLWHAGNYDPNDFLGRLISEKWVRTFEKSLAQAIDFNWFASDDHLEMFSNAFGSDQINCNRTGWPMEYLRSKLDDSIQKENLILFPHRIAPEKQPVIFKKLSNALPEYRFVVCQEKKLSKPEYHDLLQRSKIVFSANLQETLGISCYEAACAGSIPLVPDRLSYREMYFSDFKYPSEWTESVDSFDEHSDQMIGRIVEMIENHDQLRKKIKDQADFLHENYFSFTKLLNYLDH